MISYFVDVACTMWTDYIVLIVELDLLYNFVMLDHYSELGLIPVIFCHFLSYVGIFFT